MDKPEEIIENAMGRTGSRTVDIRDVQSFWRNAKRAVKVGRDFESMNRVERNLASSAREDNRSIESIDRSMQTKMNSIAVR